MRNGTTSGVAEVRCGAFAVRTRNVGLCDRRTENGRGNDMDNEIKKTKDGDKRVGAEIDGA